MGIATTIPRTISGELSAPIVIPNSRREAEQTVVRVQNVVEGGYILNNRDGSKISATTEPGGMAMHRTGRG